MKRIVKLEKFMPPADPSTRLENLLSQHGFECDYSQDYDEIVLHLFQNRVKEFKVTLKIPNAEEWVLPYPGELDDQNLARYRDDPDWYPTQSFSEKFSEASREFIHYRLPQFCDVIEAHLKIGNLLTDLFPADHCLFDRCKQLRPAAP